jgi:hypothetical protein
MPTEAFIHFDIIGLGKFAEAMEDWKLRADAASESIVRKGGAIVADFAKAQFGHGSGDPTPPQPTSRTGGLAKSIQTGDVKGSGGTWSSKTGPTIIYGRRIELGYHGVDSLGRNYGPPNQGQPPYPFLAPGLLASKGALKELLETEWGAAAVV